MPRRSIKSFMESERPQEVARRKKLARNAKRKSRERNRAAGVAPEKDARTNRERASNSEYMRQYRANQKEKNND